MSFFLLQLLGLALVAQAQSYACDYGAQPSSDGEWCYIFSEGPHSFKEANDYCDVFLPPYAYLASIRNASDNEVITGISDGELFWIGAHYNDTTNEWQWLDGSTVNYSNWMAGHHNPAGKNMCAAVDSITGLWIARHCNQNLNFVCQKQVTTNPNCPAGVTCYKGFGYVMPPVWVSSWQRGEDYCVDKYSTGAGGHLVSIHDKYEEEIVERMVMEFGNSQWAFIGGIVKDGNVTWSDGTPYDRKFYYPGENENGATNGQCLQICLTDKQGQLSHGWVLQQCGDTFLPIICKFPLQ